VQKTSLSVRTALVITHQLSSHYYCQNWTEKNSSSPSFLSATARWENVPVSSASGLPNHAFQFNTFDEHYLFTTVL
jgi:hypothetical protein